ncbi:hypothetical protein DYB30_012978 [Aphanomyces astaci]|uniref:Uncharacterized protein n=1 Tax=Aphanomyces astaci TaxID=112090 RepID=A0A397EV01_APHAT|nr:hypothetical protein DYB30_012978 [Aphanomyces astaci]RHZ05946.1 hypothetical protein DYB31_014058 [Aphanomyces astaci]
MDRMSILFGHVPRAALFVKKLTADRLLVCKTHTTRVFSCGASSTQRGEATNSRLKGNGTKKMELRRYSLYKLLKWYLTTIGMQDEASLQQLVQYITRGDL